MALLDFGHWQVPDRLRGVMMCQSGRTERLRTLVWKMASRTLRSDAIEVSFGDALGEAAEAQATYQSRAQLDKVFFSSRTGYSRRFEMCLGREGREFPPCRRWDGQLYVVSYGARIRRCLLGHVWIVGHLANDAAAIWSELGNEIQWVGCIMLGFARAWKIIVG